MPAPSLALCMQASDGCSKSAQVEAAQSPTALNDARYWVASIQRAVPVLVIIGSRSQSERDLH